ncbi:MAG TPA: hypothetical protein VFU02_11095 [Polyangiaceae bacterium]|nr:hypothetical protein [Polyangiaceae bacterium]
MELPSGQVVRAVIQRYARLISRLEDELGERPMVLPNGNFFPDHFRGDERSVQKLVRRMQAHAGIGDIPIRVSVVSQDAAGSAGDAGESGSCGSGGCAVPTIAAHGLERLVDEGDGWRLQLLEAELRHPVVLSTNIARSLAYVFLVETKEEHEVIEPPVDITADMTAVALGLGSLMLQGSYIYAKSCGGPSIARVTKMSCPELAIAFAAFIVRGDHSVREALKELDATQRELLGEAHLLFESNRHVVAQLRNAPAKLAQGEIELSEAKPWLSRMFSRRKELREQDPLEALSAGAELEELENMLTEMPPSSAARRPSRSARPATDDDLKKLVAEAFGSARAGAR